MLLECSGCGNQVSEKAPACLHCGDPKDLNISKLRTELYTPRECIQCDAITKLLELGPRAYEALPEIVSALGNLSEDIRCIAVKTLGAIGPKAIRAVPLIEKAMNDSKNGEEFRHIAKVSLRSIQRR